MGGPLSWSNSYALEFDATNEAVQVDQNYSTIYAGSFSINFWIKGDGTNHNFYIWNTEGSNYSTGDRFWLNTHGNGYLDLRFRSDNNEVIWKSAYPTSNKIVPLDTNWHNVGITITKSATGTTASTIAVYVDGEPITVGNTTGSVTSAQQANWSETVDTFIGRLQFGDGSSMSPNDPFLIDEIGLWNTALSAANHGAIYNSGTAMNLQADSGNYNTSANLQAYFRFEEGSGSSTSNSVGPADVGDLLNSPNWRINTP